MLLWVVSYKGSFQNKFLVKVGNLAQPVPRTLGFQKGKKKLMFILHFRLF